MISSLGNMFDDTIALTRIIMSGLLDQLPKLKLVCPHLGGTLPYIIGRLDHQVRVLKRGPKYLTRLPSEYLKSVWLDIVSPLPLAMRYCYDFMGPDRLLFASDRPWVNPKEILDGLRSLGLPPADELSQGKATPDEPGEIIAQWAEPELLEVARVFRKWRASARCCATILTRPGSWIATPRPRVLTIIVRCTRRRAWTT